jgi:hypothetical protein
MGWIKPGEQLHFAAVGLFPLGIMVYLQQEKG